MPNGGSIACVHCANASLEGRCEIFGTEVTPFLLCRMFRIDRQSIEEARLHWPLLNRLEPGVVYAIENAYPATAGAVPLPAFRVTPVRPNER